ncbi:MAG: DUF177 domain-containing protein [Alphaproteobacteria bacterium]|nr:DUF177 domain-containing protein [Alphaproteobacteria bacterium]
MKLLRSFDIDIIRLKEGEHQFSFKIDSAFLSNFDGNDIAQNGSLDAVVTLLKQASVIEVWFDISGTVELTCDRSLETYDESIQVKERVLYKYGPEEKELNEDIFIITNDTASINVAQLIYEFILLAVPAKRIHPNYREEDEEDAYDEDGKLVYVSDTTDTSVDDENSENPLWEELKKLKNKK